MEAPRPLGRDDRQRLGRLGERAAALRLERDGLSVVERRYRTSRGEIDLIATQGDLVVFVEVKTRSGSGYGRPAEAVGPVKRRRMASVAQHYLCRRRWSERPCRFDVIEVVVSRDEVASVRHIPDAFRLWPTG